jgi:6-phosphogluconate dehydrogenase
VRADISVIGLGSMGYNLAINIADKGYTVKVFDILAEKVKKIVDEDQGKGRIVAANSLKETVSKIKKPRKVLLMIKSGDPVDNVIKKLQDYLSEGDIIIDGGNSYYKDTQRRQKYLKRSNIFLIGMGISGGTNGALNGPSMMPGGDIQAYKPLKRLFEDIAAKAADGRKCVSYKGRYGSGHYIKMVHNGIEYADMQLIGECFWVMNQYFGRDLSKISNIFEKWNTKGDRLRSFLIGATAKILKTNDISYPGKRPLIWQVADYTQMTGTGTWTVMSALEQLIPVPTIASAVFSREFSELKEKRQNIAKSIIINDIKTIQKKYKKEDFIKIAHDALLVAKIASYSQGFALLEDASDRYDYGLDLSGIARDWRAGCIIEADILNEIYGYLKEKGNKNILLKGCFAGILNKKLDSLAKFINISYKYGIPIPCFTSAYSYIIQSASEDLLSSRLTAILRDHFGSHGYFRTDEHGLGMIKEQDKPKRFHNKW